MKKHYLLFAFVLFLSSIGYSQITLVQFATGLSEPVDIKNAGDHRLFVVERIGRIAILDTTGIKYPGYFLNITNEVESGYNEQGLLGLAFDPDYQNNGYFYCYYIQKNTDRVHLSRFSVSATNPDSADPNSEQLLLDIYHPYQNHNGGHIAFGPDGYLYIGTGDGGSGNDPGNRSQNLDSLLGKMLRIDVSGGGAYSIPPTNPFINNPNARPEIWARGLRNPWRWSFDRYSGDLWIGDVGQGIWEEVDYQPAGIPGGRNYGWRCYEGLVHTSGVTTCSPTDTIQPVYVYPHSTGGCSITGGYIYRGAKFSNMFGKYFFSDYCLKDIKYLQSNGNGGFNFTNLGSLTSVSNSFVAFGEDQWGELYIADLVGKIYRFQGQSCSPVAYISDKDTVVVCGGLSTTLQTPAGQGFTYIWSFNGGSAGTNVPSLTATQSGNYSVNVLDNNGCFATSSTVYVSFVSAPTASFTGLDTVYCINYAPATLVPVPTGGVFSGAGITGSTFNPATAGIGIHDITYNYTDVNGCVATDVQQVRIDACTGIENNYFGHLELLPNPSAGDFMLSFYSRSNELLNFEIINVVGQVVYNEKINVAAGLHKLDFEIHDPSKGLYSIKVNSVNGSAVKKFVVN